MISLRYGLGLKFFFFRSVVFWSIGLQNVERNLLGGFPVWGKNEMHISPFPSFCVRLSGCWFGQPWMSFLANHEPRIETLVWMKVDELFCRVLTPSWPLPVGQGRRENILVVKLCPLGGSCEYGDEPSGSAVADSLRKTIFLFKFGVYSATIRCCYLDDLLRHIRHYRFDLFTSSELVTCQEDDARPG